MWKVYIPNISGDVSAFLICSAEVGPCFGDVSGEVGMFCRFLLKGLNRAVLSSRTSKRSAVKQGLVRGRILYIVLYLGDLKI